MLKAYEDSVLDIYKFQIHFRRFVESFKLQAFLAQFLQTLFEQKYAVFTRCMTLHDRNVNNQCTRRCVSVILRQPYFSSIGQTQLYSNQGLVHMSRRLPVCVKNTGQSRNAYVHTRSKYQKQVCKRMRISYFQIPHTRFLSVKHAFIPIRVLQISHGALPHRHRARVFTYTERRRGICTRP